MAGGPHQGQDGLDRVAKTVRRDREDEHGPTGHGPSNGRVQLSMVVEDLSGVDG